MCSSLPLFYNSFYVCGTNSINLQIEKGQVKEECRKYMEKLLNENTLDNTTTCENVEGPCELIRRDEILKALRMMKKGKAAAWLYRNCVGNVYG